MASKTIRVVTLDSDGSIRSKDFDSIDEVIQLHEQVGIDDCSTDLSLRGLPVFRGLIGPIPESKKIARYESPDVFEALTKEWSQIKARRRRRRKASEIEAGVPMAPIPAPLGLGKNPITSAEFV